jgi:hypothetical protein
VTAADFKDQLERFARDVNAGVSAAGPDDEGALVRYRPRRRGEDGVFVRGAPVRRPEGQCDKARWLHL